MDREFVLTAFISTTCVGTDIGRQLLVGIKGLGFLIGGGRKQQ